MGERRHRGGQVGVLSRGVEKKSRVTTSTLLSGCGDWTFLVKLKRGVKSAIFQS